MESTSIGGPLEDSTVPSLMPMKRGTAPTAINSSATARTLSPSTPLATNRATRRASTHPLPGRANSESAGDSLISGVTSFWRAFGIGAGSVVIPNPSATASASSLATFISPETIRSRTAGVWTRDSSKRKALMMWVFSTAVWLFQKSVAWV